MGEARERSTRGNLGQDRHWIALEGYKTQESNRIRVHANSVAGCQEFCWRGEPQEPRAGRPGERFGAHQNAAPKR